MEYRDRIATALAETLDRSFGVKKSPSEVAESLEVPKDAKMGDAAFPCFPLARVLKKNPAQIASELAESLLPWVEAEPGIARAEAVGPYLNFFIDRADLAGRILPSILNGEFLAEREQTGVRVMIEYSQPNTHKAFHVGHIRNVALGSAHHPFV